MPPNHIQWSASNQYLQQQIVLHISKPTHTHTHTHIWVYVLGFSSEFICNRWNNYYKGSILQKIFLSRWMHQIYHNRSVVAAVWSWCLVVYKSSCSKPEATHIHLVWDLYSCQWLIINLNFFFLITKSNISKWSNS